jgi:hypothetical protein
MLMTSWMLEDSNQSLFMALLYIHLLVIVMKLSYLMATMILPLVDRLISSVRRLLRYVPSIFVGY